MSKYYAYIPHLDGSAFGTGTTKEDALQDAKNWIDWDVTDADLDHVYEITAESYKKVTDGYGDNYQLTEEECDRRGLYR